MIARTSTCMWKWLLRRPNSAESSFPKENNLTTVPYAEGKPKDDERDSRAKQVRTRGPRLHTTVRAHYGSQPSTRQPLAIVCPLYKIIAFSSMHSAQPARGRNAAVQSPCVARRQNTRRVTAGVGGALLGRLCGEPPRNWLSLSSGLSDFRPPPPLLGVPAPARLTRAICEA